MTINADMFPNQDVGTNATHQPKWHMVTNQRNLQFMLGAGMVIPPAGFGNKYFQDTLSCFPGWIPIFPDSVPKAAIHYSVAEKSHLAPCILEFNLELVKGTVKAVQIDGSVNDIAFPEEITGRENFILFPAPLPTTLISSIVFESKEHKVNFEKDSSDFGNVDLSGLTLRSLKGAFSKATTHTSWPQQIPEIVERPVPLERPLAAGGILAMLSHIANIGDLPVNTARIAFQRGDDATAVSPYSILRVLGDWLEAKELSAESESTAGIYWSLVDNLIAARTNGDQAPLDVVLDSIRTSSVNMETSAKANLEDLAKELEGIVGLGKYSPTELFERHTKPLPRALILFFLRESCDEIIEHRHPLLTEYDYVAATMLFAVRERWLGLPVSLRNNAVLNGACCHRMAAMSHSLAENYLQFGDAPARPISLRELLRDLPWKKPQHEAALLLARKCQWDCIVTRVSLGKGEYRLEVDGQGVHFVLAGEPKAVKTEADYETVLKQIGEKPLPEKIEIAARALLKAPSA